MHISSDSEHCVPIIHTALYKIGNSHRCGTGKGWFIWRIEGRLLRNRGEVTGSQPQAVVLPAQSFVDQGSGPRATNTSATTCCLSPATSVDRAMFMAGGAKFANDGVPWGGELGSCTWGRYWGGERRGYFEDSRSDVAQSEQAGASTCSPGAFADQSSWIGPTCNQSMRW